MRLNLLNVFLIARACLAASFLLFSSISLAETFDDASYQQWLKARFGAQHEKLIPIVAVADMYFSCNQVRQVEKNAHPIKHLITRVDKNVLAEQLHKCLAGESPKSDIALNYGLKGCFYEQFASLAPQEKQVKMRLVNKAITALSRAERQKSFTQCVTDQAITYLK